MFKACFFIYFNAKYLYFNIPILMKYILYSSYFFLFVVVFSLSSCTKRSDENPIPIQEKGTPTATLPEECEATAGTATPLSTNTTQSISLFDGLQGHTEGGTWEYVSGPSTVTPLQDKVSFSQAGTYVFTYTVSCGLADSNMSVHSSIEVSVEKITKVYEGNIGLRTQAEVDAFVAEGWTEVTGNVGIGKVTMDGAICTSNCVSSNISSLSDLKNLTSIGGSLSIHTTSLTSLEGLEGITSLGGDLRINGNDVLVSLSGLDELTSLGGDLEISGNVALASLSGLDGLTSITKGVSIANNLALTSLSGLEGINSINQHLLISENPALTSLSGLEGVNAVGPLLVSDNLALTSLSGLENLTSAQVLHITNNSALTSLSSLSKLTFIRWQIVISNNDALISLSGLEGITAVGWDFEINDNDALTSLSGLGNITSIEGRLQIANNAILTSLSALESITSIKVNVLIENNVSLSNFCTLTRPANNGTLKNYEAKTNAFNPTLQDLREERCSQ